MSSDLRDLVHHDLEKIPLPPDAAWTQRRRRRERHGIGLVASAAIVAVVVIASLSGGQVLRSARDRIDALRAPTNVLIAGNDLVYVAYADLPRAEQTGLPMPQGLQVLAMPTGQLIARVDAATYVGTTIEGGLMGIGGDVAVLPEARQVAPGQYEGYLQRIDLRRGRVTSSVAIGGTGGAQAPSVMPGSYPFAAATVMSGDGRFVWLVRDTNERGRIALVERFPLYPDSTRVFPTVPTGGYPHTAVIASGTGIFRSRLVQLGADKVMLVRDVFESLGGLVANHIATDWYVLDAQLNVIKSYAEDDASRLPVSRSCGTDVREDPTGAGWLLLCSDSSGSADGELLFLDGRTFEVTGSVRLDRVLGFAVDMAVASDGQVYVLTDRPVVVRIDPRTRTRIDARTVTRTRAFFEDLVPPVAAAKEYGGPRAILSPDGRYAYIADMPDRWGAVATIDLATATVIASNNQVGTVIALALSSGGERLYALTSASDGARSLVLLESRTLALAARAQVSPYSFAIVAVRGDAR